MEKKYLNFKKICSILFLNLFFSINSENQEQNRACSSGNCGTFSNACSTGNCGTFSNSCSTGNCNFSNACNTCTTPCNSCITPCNINKPCHTNQCNPSCALPISGCFSFDKFGKIVCPDPKCNFTVRSVPGTGIITFTITLTNLCDTLVNALASNSTGNNMTITIPTSNTIQIVYTQTTAPKDKICFIATNN